VFAPFNRTFSPSMLIYLLLLHFQLPPRQRFSGGHHRQNPGACGDAAVVVGGRGEGEEDVGLAGVKTSHTRKLRIRNKTGCDVDEGRRNHKCQHCDDNGMGPGQFHIIFG